MADRSASSDFTGLSSVLLQSSSSSHPRTQLSSWTPTWREKRSATTQYKHAGWSAGRSG